MPEYPHISQILANVRWFLSSDTVWSHEYRDRKIEDYRAFTVAMMLALGPVAAGLWVWEWVVDPLNAPKTVPWRVLCLLIALLAAALYSRARRPLSLRVVVFSSIIAVELIYAHITTMIRVDGHFAEASYLFFAFGALLITQGLPALDAILGVVALAVIPHMLALAGFLPNFDHAYYAVIVWPGSAMASAAMLASSYTYSQLYVARVDLERVSAVDPLTGAANRREFEPVLRKELARSRRFGHPLALLMLDLDEFKLVNDECGHSVGDLVLETFAEMCRQFTRQTDTLARLGGDEFAILLPETDISGALLLAEAIRTTAEDDPALTADGCQVRCTVSIGVAVLEPSDASPQALMARGDAKLYEAKQSGRNCVRPAVPRAGMGVASKHGVA